MENWLSKEVKRELKIEPKLITIDGVDGSGTTTIADALALELKSRGLSVKRIHVPEAGKKNRARNSWEARQIKQKSQR